MNELKQSNNDVEGAGAMLGCPFCGSTDLSDNTWWLEEDGEVDAVECSQCYAGAPVKTWNKRHSKAANR